MSYSKEQIDNDAEREGIALCKAGKTRTINTDRVKQRENYGKKEFEKLFKK